MENSSLSIFLDDIKEKRKIKGDVLPTIENPISVEVSCSECMKAKLLPNGRVEYTYKAPEVPKQLRFHPGFGTIRTKIFVTNREGHTQTIHLHGKVVV